MESISTIGLDIAKSVFQVHAISEAGEVVVLVSSACLAIRSARLIACGLTRSLRQVLTVNLLAHFAIPFLRPRDVNQSIKFAMRSLNSRLGGDHFRCVVNGSNESATTWDADVRLESIFAPLINEIMHAWRKLTREFLDLQ